MKARYILSLLVLNFALFCVFSIFQEYNGLDDKIASLNYTVSSSVDSAIQLSMVSEELFNDMDSWNSKVTSKNDDNANLRYYDGTGWKVNNFYSTCLYFNNHSGNNVFKRFPSSDVSNDSEDIYDWLYTDSSNFKSFYDNIGKYIETNMLVKSATGEGYGSGYALNSTKVPVLDQMGVFNKKLNTASDSFTKTVKSGKELQSVSSGSYSYSLPTSTSGKSQYFLTPTSLGVTYLDPRVLQPAIIAHLETTMRYTKGADGDTASIGTIPSSIYTPSGGLYKPSIKANESIMNNGVIEIDMNSVSVNVDFALVDAYNSKNSELMSIVTGADGSSRSTSLKKSDTTQDSDSTSGKRIVAKVTTKMNVFVPYTSPVMQWVRYMGRLNNYDHLSIREIKDDGNFKSSDSSSLEFTYTSYVSVER